MAWFSVNPDGERLQVMSAAMALSGWYPQGWHESGEYVHEIPKVSEVYPEELAELYNNADVLGVDIYTVQDTK